MDTHTASDIELARRARAGDREALGALVERLRPGLFALAYAELRHYEAAQDAVASAILQICRHVGELRDPGLAWAWIRSIARNEVRLIRRRRAHRREEFATECVEEMAETGSASAAAESHLRLDIEQALRRLPRDQARAVALHYLSGLPVEEIARRCDRPVGTIKRWLHGGRQRLARELEEYAPMTALPASDAAIFSSDLNPQLVERMVAAARAAGFANVVTLNAPPDMQVVDETREVHLPEAMKRVSVVVLDEWVAGRSAFEILIMLKAAAESRNLAYFMLADAPGDGTIFAAHSAGVDCFLTKPFDLGEFQKFMRLLRERQASGVEA